jgi:hypothetical protein
MIWWALFICRKIQQLRNSRPVCWIRYVWDGSGSESLDLYTGSLIRLFSSVALEMLTKNTCFTKFFLLISYYILTEGTTFTAVFKDNKSLGSHSWNQGFPKFFLLVEGRFRTPNNNYWSGSKSWMPEKLREPDPAPDSEHCSRQYKYSMNKVQDLEFFSHSKSRSRLQKFC